MGWLARLAAVVWVVMMAEPAAAQTQLVRFSDMPGWAEDDHLAGLQTFLQTCDLLKGDEWKPICALAEQAKTPAAARAFFEMFFRPVLIGSPPALFTGYFEPELNGSTSRSSRFAWPIYRRPPELKDGMTWHDRATIERGILRGRGWRLPG